MPARRSLTTIGLALTLLLLVAVPARAEGCGLVGQLLTCDPVEEPPEILVTPDGWLTLSGADGSVPSPGSGGPAVVDSAGALRLLELANQERTAAGLGVLTSRADLVDLALAHTFAMVESDSIFHNLDLLGRPLRVLGTDVVGENVGWSTDVDDLHRRLMASPGHRANLLEPRFTVVGMAVVATGNGRYYATQDFAQAQGSLPEARAAAPVASPSSERTSPTPSPPVAEPTGLPSASPASTPTTPATESVSSPTSRPEPTPAMTDGRAQVPAGRAHGEVESFLATPLVADEVPTAPVALVVLAVALAGIVALADGAVVVRDRRLAR